MNGQWIESVFTVLYIQSLFSLSSSSTRLRTFLSYDSSTIMDLQYRVLRVQRTLVIYSTCKAVRTYDKYSTALDYCIVYTTTTAYCYFVQYQHLNRTVNDSMSLPTYLTGIIEFSKVRWQTSPYRNVESAAAYSRTRPVPGCLVKGVTSVHHHNHTSFVSHCAGGGSRC